MCPEKIVSDVFGYPIDTIKFLEQLEFKTQDFDTEKYNTVKYLINKGFSASPPEKLYRYRPPKHVIDEITNSYIHYSSVASMSDPYDCLISSRLALEKIGLWDDIGHEELEEIINTIIRKQIHVCCFSESYTSFSMWDQYAAGHKGVCIEYDSKQLSKLDIIPMRVKYSNKSFQEFNDNATDITELLMEYLSGCALTKNRDYAHEYEWRSFGGIMNNLSVNDAIDCVYIGSRCSKGKRNIIRLCKEMGIDVVKLSVCESDYSFLEYRI